MFAQRPKTFAKISGGFVFLAGVAVLLGWALNLAVLKSVFPGAVLMKPNTAVGMVMGGFSLALLARDQAGARARYCAAALGLATSVLGLLTLGEYFFGWDVGMDKRLFLKAIEAEGVSSRSGRMSPATAFCFVLAGLALAAASQLVLRSLRLPVLSALGASLIGLGGLASLGQMLSALLHFHLWNDFGMAIHTALGFTLLGCGLLALVRGEKRMAWALDKNTTAGFIVAIVIMLTAAGVSWNYTDQLQEATA